MSHSRPCLGVSHARMSTSNTTWACFECREAVRRPRYNCVAVNCACCGQPCRNIGHRIRLPSKRAVKAWEQLRLSLQQQLVEDAERRHRHRVRSIHRIEREIARLQVLPANEGRRKQIGLLRKRLVES
jgi:hypothetical protein